MHAARDAEDTRLLGAGEHRLLVAGYFHQVRERCFLRLRDRDAGDEAAQQVFVRLLAELGRGRRYRHPFRVVVWMVTEWTLRGFGPGPAASPLEDWDDGIDDASYAEWEAEHDLALLLAELPPRQREVAELRYRDGLAHEQIAHCLGLKRNAVDQALHNAHGKLREKLRG
jgi:DNA-directed RNA polymerase specialized sigma24 family protein